mmetsp:Transcript_153693/g.491483  ORF Transcript_153693/g.491483 Transcript_153693/m.491483 type:complete len:389 (+) Transcript_153693:185-1351(+)
MVHGREGRGTFELPSLLLNWAVHASDACYATAHAVDAARDRRGRSAERSPDPRRSGKPRRRKTTKAIRGELTLMARAARDTSSIGRRRVISDVFATSSNLCASRQQCREPLHAVDASAAAALLKRQERAVLAILLKHEHVGRTGPARHCPLHHGGQRASQLRPRRHARRLDLPQLLRLQWCEEAEIVRGVGDEEEGQPNPEVALVILPPIQHGVDVDSNDGIRQAAVHLQWVELPPEELVYLLLRTEGRERPGQCSDEAIEKPEGSIQGKESGQVQVHTPASSVEQDQRATAGADKKAPIRSARKLCAITVQDRRRKYQESCGDCAELRVQVAGLPLSLEGVADVRANWRPLWSGLQRERRRGLEQGISRGPRRLGTECEVQVAQRIS